MPQTDRSRNIARTLLIDADDTLWENNIFYLRCEARFLDYVESLGCDRQATRRILRGCEQEMVAVHGYGPGGFVAALGLACERSLGRDGDEGTAALVARARSLGHPILSPPMVLLPDVEVTLVALRPTSRLVLVTKGDEATQMAKVQRSGLGPMFDASYIVPEKSVHTYRRVAAELGLSPRRTWMVGNSPKSDINPAVQAGLGAIFIPHGHTWEAELQAIERPESVVALQRFADLLPLFGIEMAAAPGQGPGSNAI